MLFLKQIPKGPTAEFVDYLWLVSDAPAHATERILPAGTLELVLNLHEDEIRIYDEAGSVRRLSGTILSGAYGHPFLIDTREHALTMGVHFLPGGALPFIAATPGELCDAHVDLELVWGPPARELRERLCEASTHEERFRILDEALLARAASGQQARPLVRHAVRALARANVSVRDVVERVGLSHRHFTNVFREQVGMTPKLFARVRRFQRAVDLANARSHADLAALAAECGYWDQAHMIRDFEAFARATPGQYLRRSSAPVKDHHVALSSAPSTR